MDSISESSNTYHVLENDFFTIIINDGTGMINKISMRGDKSIETVDIGDVEVRTMDLTGSHYLPKPHTSEIIQHDDSVELRYLFDDNMETKDGVIKFGTEIIYIINSFDLEVKVDHKIPAGMQINETIAWLYLLRLNNNISLSHRFEELVLTSDGMPDPFFAEQYSNNSIYAYYLEVDPKIIVSRKLIVPARILEDHNTKTFMFYGSYDLESPIFFHNTPGQYFFGLFPSNQFRNTAFPESHSFKYSFFISLVPYEEYSMNFLLERYLNNLIKVNTVTKQELTDKGIFFDRYLTQMFTYDPSEGVNEWQIITNKHLRAPKTNNIFPKTGTLIVSYIVFFIISALLLKKRGKK